MQIVLISTRCEGTRGPGKREKEKVERSQEYEFKQDDLLDLYNIYIYPDMTSEHELISSRHVKI